MNKALINWWSGGVSYDTDYQAWLTQIIADGGTQPSSSVKTAQNALVVALKANSLWTRVKAGWFLHCGDLTTGRRNIANPSTFRTSLVGNNVFTEGSGTKSDGSASCINTTYAANQYSGIQTDLSTFLYISTSVTTPIADQFVYGVRIATASDTFVLIPRASGTNAINRKHYLGSGIATVANSNHKGFYAHTYDGTNDVVYKDGAKTATSATPVAPTISAPLLLLARNANAGSGVTPADYYSIANLAYFFLFDRLSDSDESTLRGLFTTYNTSAGLP